MRVCVCVCVCEKEYTEKEIQATPSKVVETQQDRKSYSKGIVKWNVLLFSIGLWIVFNNFLNVD